MGLETIGWGFRKTDGVPVGLVGSQWSRPSMGMLQGVEGLFCTVVARLKVARGCRDTMLHASSSL